MKNTIKKGVIGALFCFGLPGVGLAQAYYSSDTNLYYEPYRCGSQGVVCGEISQSQSFSRPQQPTQSPVAFQTASVADAFQTSPAAPTPHLPKTGGGGKSLSTKESVGYGFLLPIAAAVLVVGTIILGLIKKPESRFEMEV